MNDDRGKILIAGAGIGGLTLAIALKQRGMDVQVFEQTPKISPAGAGITLWSNALCVMEALGTADAILDAGMLLQGGGVCTSKGKVVTQMNTGDLLNKHSLARVCAVHRGALHEILLDALPDDVVVLGARCTGYTQDEEGVTAHFAGHEDVRGGLLVGADGIGSAVRAQLRDDGPPRYSGYTCWRGVSDFVADPGDSWEVWGPGLRFGFVPISKEHTYWFSCADAPARQSLAPEVRKGKVSTLFAGWSKRIPEIIALTPEDKIIHNDIDDRPPCRGWSEGRVVLLGDAAHPTTPNMGQGACMAIESAMILARCLEKFAQLSEAFACYEALRQERTAKVTNTSWKVGAVGQWSNPMARWLRNLLVGMIPASSRDRQLLELISHNVVQQSLET